MPPKKAAPDLISLSTINEDGSRRFLHPVEARGRFTFWRRVVAMLIIGVFIALPLIKINGYPAVLFDLAERRFHLFGLTFVSRDFWLGFFLVSGLAFSLFFVTSLLGRIWCGWTCPYTVWLEHVFRRVERWIEGDASKQQKLDDSSWNSEKILKRGFKHLVFVLLAFLIVTVFVSYFVPLKDLFGVPGKHVKAFGVIVFLSAALYFCFSWFREQFCVILCPYGRIQSALSDDNTMVIGYDGNRGEPRGKPRDPNTGDCVNCRKCVDVCPTGIDIRNGLQMECIGCAACIDACDQVMERLKRPRGLIRYSSYNALKGDKTHWFRPRIAIYLVMMAIGAGAFAFSLSRVHPVEFTVTRMQGMPFYESDGTVRNQYQITLENKRNQTSRFTLDAEGAPADVQLSGFDTNGVEIDAQGEQSYPFIVIVPNESYTGTFPLTLTVTAEPGGTTISRTIDFLGPLLKKNKP